MLEQILSRSEIPDLTNIKLPFVIKNRILMSPGIWNNFYYDSDTIGNAFENSDWEDKTTRSLLWDHEDLKASKWIGEVKNERMVGKNLVGDLIVVDEKAARALAYGAKFGISPKVIGDEENQVMSDYIFANFSVVINPAVKTAFINNSEIKIPESGFEVVKKCDFKMDENYTYFINAGGDVCKINKAINMAEEVKKEEVKEEPEAEEVSEETKEPEELSEEEKGILKAANEIRKRHSLEEEVKEEEKKEEPEDKEEEKPESPAEKEPKEEPKEVENKDASVLKEIRTIVKSLGDRMGAIEKTVKDLSSEPEAKKEFKMSQVKSFGMLPSSVSEGDKQMMGFMRQHI